MHSEKVRGGFSIICFQRVGIHTFSNWDTLKGMFPNKIPDSKKESECVSSPSPQNKNAASPWPPTILSIAYLKQKWKASYTGNVSIEKEGGNDNDTTS